jgi:transcription factor E
MQVKFLKSVVENLINKQAVPIVDLLVGKKDVNEFLIAKKLDLTINQTRKILYTLSDYGLVSFIRKKDKRKGWYIYFWTLNTYQSLKLLEENLKKELKNLEKQLKERQEKRYYQCNTCSLEVTEETALSNDFICNECEEVYELSDNKDLIAQIEKNISRVEKELELVIAERKKEEQKLEKKKARKIKKAEAERKAKRKARTKKSAKKPVKKKTVKKKAVKKSSVKKPKKRTKKPAKKSSKVKSKLKKKK